MKIHFMGKYNLDEKSLPAEEHKPNAVKFKEPESSKGFSKIANGLGLVALSMCMATIVFRLMLTDTNIKYWQVFLGLLLPNITLFFHEFLHAICFKKDAYIFTNLKQGMLFVVGTEDMSKSRFIFMSLLPNIVFGFIPFIIGLIYTHLISFSVFGAVCIAMGAGDYYNIFNALTQMPKGARTYLHKFNSYWYMP